MKKKNVFTFALAFVLGALIVLPVFGEDNQIDSAELGRLIKAEFGANKKLNTQKGIDVRYFTPISPNNWAQESCNGMKKIDLESVVKIIKSKGVPNTCKQYDVMHYLISQRDHDTLKQVLYKGYNPLVYRTIDSKPEKLISEVALFNDKKGFNILLDQIKNNGIGIFKNNLENKDIEDVIISELYSTINVIINNCAYDCDSIKHLRDILFRTEYFQVVLPKDKQISDLSDAIYRYIDSHERLEEK